MAAIKHVRTTQTAKQAPVSKGGPFAIDVGRRAIFNHGQFVVRFVKRLEPFDLDTARLVLHSQHLRGPRLVGRREVCRHFDTGDVVHEVGKHPDLLLVLLGPDALREDRTKRQQQMEHISLPRPEHTIHPFHGARRAVNVDMILRRMLVDASTGQFLRLALIARLDDVVVAVGARLAGLHHLPLHDGAIPRVIRAKHHILIAINHHWPGYFLLNLLNRLDWRRAASRVGQLVVQLHQSIVDDLELELGSERHHVPAPALHEPRNILRALVRALGVHLGVVLHDIPQPHVRVREPEQPLPAIQRREQLVQHLTNILDVAERRILQPLANRVPIDLLQDHPPEDHLPRLVHTHARIIRGRVPREVPILVAQHRHDAHAKLPFVLKIHHRRRKLVQKHGMGHVRMTNLEHPVQRPALRIDQCVHLCLRASAQQLANIAPRPQLFPSLLLKVERNHARARDGGRRLPIVPQSHDVKVGGRDWIEVQIERN
mmetsp:Transcript_11192/g.31278  ORF Transcript_11192/g.31278 Transcript_11192/m.31278 type:complete len:486 (-) Transcript_11192:73-1530(-)